MHISPSSEPNRSRTPHRTAILRQQQVRALLSERCIVQHMPPQFTAAFADRLNRLCEITVREARTTIGSYRGLR